jgi:DNA polymerase
MTLFGREPSSLDALNAEGAALRSFVPGGVRAVFGEGPLFPPIAFVGEQPGDRDDVAGRPFVGPEGEMLDRALAQAGVDRAACYLTNAVKHFKFVQRGKLRLRQTPIAGEVKHYRWWLDCELEIVAPRVVATLGATALLAVTGKAGAVSRLRGPTRFGDRPGFITIHPSAILRAPGERREADFQAFVADMRAIRQLAGLA